MRLYYVVTDTSPTKKTPEQRHSLIEDMRIHDLESDTPNRIFQAHKVDATGSQWFGGIDLDGPAIDRLSNRRKGETGISAKLSALLQSELRAVLGASERARFTVEVVAVNEDAQAASEAALDWLKANWDYLE